MKRTTALAAVLLSISVATFEMVARAQAPGAWTTVLDGTTLKGWDPVGTANWSVKDGAIEATSGAGFLVTPIPYGDFELRSEIWVSEDANSGIFIRCEDPKAPAGSTGYEVNVFDKRPDPKYRTGAIVNVAEPKVQFNAANKWSVLEISAKGSHLIVKLDGVVTADAMDAKHPKGHIALQGGTGTVRWRKVEIRTL